MIRFLLEQTGIWGVPLGALLLWSVVLLLHRLLIRSELRKEATHRSRQLALLTQAWRLPDSDPDPTTASQHLGDARQATQSIWPALAGAPRLTPQEFAAEMLPRLAPPHGGAQASSSQLETCAALSPIIGLAGTIAGYYLTLQEVARSDLTNGLAALAGPGALAMTTSLLGIIPCAVSMLTIGLIRVDAERNQLADELVRWHGNAHRTWDTLTRAAAARVPEPAPVTTPALTFALLPCNCFPQP